MTQIRNTITCVLKTLLSVPQWAFSLLLPRVTGLPPGRHSCVSGFGLKVLGLSPRSWLQDIEAWHLILPPHLREDSEQPSCKHAHSRSPLGNDSIRRDATQAPGWLHGAEQSHQRRKRKPPPVTPATVRCYFFRGAFETLGRLSLSIRHLNTK